MPGNRNEVPSCQNSSIGCLPPPPASSALAPGSRSRASFWKAGLRSSRAGCDGPASIPWLLVHSDHGALPLTNVMVPSLLDYLLCLCLCYSGNLPGGSSLECLVFPFSFSCALTPLQIPNLGFYPFFYLLGHLPPLTSSS